MHIFLKYHIKTQSIKEPNNNLDFTNINNFSSKDSIKRMKSYRAGENSLQSMCVVKVLDLESKTFKY